MRSSFLGAVLSAVQLLQLTTARPQVSGAPVTTVTVSVNTAVCPATNGLPPASSPVVFPFTTTDANGNVIVGSSTSHVIAPSSTPYVVLSVTTDSTGNVITATTTSFSILASSYPYLVYFPTTDAAGRVGIGSSTAYTTLGGPVTITATTTNAVGATITSVGVSTTPVPSISFSYEYYSPTVIFYTTTNAAGSTITTYTTSAVPYTGAPTVVPYTYTNAAGSIVTGSTTSYLPYSSPATTIVFTTTKPDGSVSTGTSISYGDFIYTPPGVGLRGGVITPYTTTLPNGQTVVQFSTSFPPTTTPAAASVTTSLAPASGSVSITGPAGSSAPAPSTSVTVITGTDAQGSIFVTSSTAVVTPSVTLSSAGSLGVSGSSSAGLSGSAAASSALPSSSNLGGGANSLSSALASSGSASTSVFVTSTTNSLGSTILLSSTSTLSPSATGTCTPNTTALAPASSPHSPCPATLNSPYESNNCVAWDLYCTVDFSYNDLSSASATSLRDCISICDTYVPTGPGTSAEGLPCVAVTYSSFNPNGANCYLKSAITSATYGSSTLDSAKLHSYQPDISNISVSAYSSSTTFSAAASSTSGSTGTSLTSTTSSTSSTSSPGISPSASPSIALSASPSASSSVSSTNTDTTTTTTTTSTAPTPPLGGSTTGGAAASPSSSSAGGATASPSSTGNTAASSSSKAPPSPVGGAGTSGSSSTGGVAASSSSTGGAATSLSSTATAVGADGGVAGVGGAGASHAISRSAVTITSTTAGGGIQTTTSYSTVYATGSATYVADTNNVVAPDSAYGPCGSYGTYDPPNDSNGHPTVVSTNHYSPASGTAYNLYCGYVDLGDNLYYAHNTSSFSECISFCDTYQDPNNDAVGSSSAGTCVAANWGAYNPNGANCFLHVAASDIISSDPQYDATDFYQNLAVQRTFDPKDSEYVAPASADPPSPCDQNSDGTYPNQGTTYDANGKEPFQVFCGYDFGGGSPGGEPSAPTTFKACMDACGSTATCNAVTFTTGGKNCYFHTTPTTANTGQDSVDSAWLVSNEPGGTPQQQPLSGPPHS